MCSQVGATTRSTPSAGFTVDAFELVVYLAIADK